MKRHSNASSTVAREDRSTSRRTFDVRAVETDGLHGVFDAFCPLLCRSLMEVSGRQTGPHVVSTLIKTIFGGI